MADVREQALAGLSVLSQTCKSTLADFVTLSRSVSNTQSPPVDILRKDMDALMQLIHASTTRLSVSLGKPPSSHAIALLPLKDLTSHVAQLASCTSSLPPGLLRKEAVWAAEEVVQALDVLVQHFEGACQRGEIAGDEYLHKTGAVHYAIEKTEKLSKDEAEAMARAWKANEEGLEDSLREVNDMLENDSGGQDLGNDGWDEVGEGFGGTLKPEELQRVKKVYPLLRLTVLLHGKILSHHILKRPSLQGDPHLTRLLGLSDSLLRATDDLVSALYAPQDAEEMQEASQVARQVTTDINHELAEAGALEALAGLRLEDGANDEHNIRWFKKCFSQIDMLHDGLNLKV